MILSIVNNGNIRVDLSKPIDLSIPLQDGFENPNCFYAPMPEFSPVRAGSFVGSTQEGGVVNFKNIRLNPHGNGTHTECVGHISKEVFTINQCLNAFHFIAQLISIYPEMLENGDKVIFKKHIEDVLQKGKSNALIIRTLPNDDLKKKTNYSGANPTYIHHEAIQYMVECGIEHLLVDLPSVDREEDEGKLLAHRAFWQYPEHIRTNATITELIYVPNEAKDGFYLLNLQIASLELDATPSKPIIYLLHQK
jgi:arylformamidase